MKCVSYVELFWIAPQALAQILESWCDETRDRMCYDGIGAQLKHMLFIHIVVYCD